MYLLAKNAQAYFSPVTMKGETRMGRYLEGFKQTMVDVGDGISINVTYSGSGPALLMLHGHPETHLMWHKIAPQLAQKYIVILPDLRGYGDSSHPKGLPDHSTYSKRELANDNVKVMEHFGYRDFFLVGHDRGARVSHRLLLDHPDRVKKCMLLDIAPTYDMYMQSSMAFGLNYYHWFFLSQPPELPERLLSGDPDYFFRAMFGDYTDIENCRRIYPEDLEREYIRKLSTPEALHSICEDYRASATIDLEHDKEDLNRKTDIPLMVLFGEKGCLNQLFDVLGLWKKRGTDVSGFAVPNSGHFIAEDAPEAALKAILEFMR